MSHCSKKNNQCGNKIETTVIEFTIWKNKHYFEFVWLRQVGHFLLTQVNDYSLPIQQIKLNKLVIFDYLFIQQSVIVLL